MSKRVLMENEDISLWYHTNSGIIHHQIKRPIMGDKLRNPLSIGQQYLEEHRAIKWLSDDRLLGAFSKEDQAWCEQEWFPKVLAAGWKYWAIVLPQTVLGQMSLQYFEKKYSEQGVITKFFDTATAALTWLEEQPGNALLETQIREDAQNTNPPETEI